MTKTSQRSEQENRLAIFYLAFCGSRDRGTTNPHTGELTGNKTTKGIKSSLTHHRIKHFNSELPHFGSRCSASVDPKIVERCQRRVCGAAALQVCTLNSDYTGNWSSARPDSDLLTFMKLDPQRML